MTQGPNQSLNRYPFKYSWYLHYTERDMPLPSILKSTALAQWAVLLPHTFWVWDFIVLICKFFMRRSPTTGRIKVEDDPEEVKEGIRDGFLNIDRHMHSLAHSTRWDCSGSTAAAVMLSPRRIYLINCGDSRALLCRHARVCFYTEDHKPCNPREKARIQNAGGSVTLQRINGSLAVSRALGDFDFKEVAWRSQTEQLVSPEPEVFQLERSPADEFLVVACDGVWDAMDNEELCAFVHNQMQVTDNLQEICAQVIDLCLYKVSEGL